MNEIETQHEIVKELKVISKLLILFNSDRIELELAKVASTDDRKRMWILIDGKNMAKDIAAFLKMTEQGVGVFLRQLAESGYVENLPRRPPVRLINYVPPNWYELLADSGVEQERPQGNSAHSKTETKPE